MDDLKRFHLQVKILAFLCLPEINQIIKYISLIYAFQIPEDIDQGSLFGSKRKPNGDPVRDHNFDSICFSVSILK